MLVLRVTVEASGYGLVLLAAMGLEGPRSVMVALRGRDGDHAGLVRCLTYTAYIAHLLLP